MAHPWLNMLLVGASFGALIIGLRTLRDARRVDPELLRKLLHIGMGLVSLSLPWLFAAAWPVLLLASLFALGLGICRTSVAWHRFAGGVIDGIRCDSLGDLCFPIAVGILFLVSTGDPLTFCIPMLILTLADAAAALVGTRCGAHRYGKPGHEKSFEGSCAFFAVAFPSTYLLTEFLAGVGRAEALLLSLTLGLLVTLVEAISWKGVDNLTVPLAAFLLLRLLRGLDPGSLAACLGVTLGVMVLFGLRCRGISAPSANRCQRMT
jgi:phytol kinase